MTQNQCLIQITPQPPGTNWEVLSFDAIEGLSQDFSIHLEITSNQPLDIANLLGKALSVQLSQISPRYFNALVSEISQIKNEPSRQLIHYRLALISWFDMLKQHFCNRVFQNQTVIEIFKSVCQKVNFCQYQFKLKNSYPKRPFILQYNESSHAFLSRLLQEEGIFYYFIHDESCHMLVLCDDIHTLPKDTQTYSLATRQTEEHFTAWRPTFALSPNKCLINTYDFINPNQSLFSEATISKQLPETLSGPNFNTYTYGAPYHSLSEGKNIAKRAATHSLAKSRFIKANSNIISLAPSHLLSADVSENIAFYIVTSISHHAHDHSQDKNPNNAPLRDYHNELTCVPLTQGFSPTPRLQHTLYGYHAAKVLAQDGNEIDTDEYARARAQFLWEKKTYLLPENTFYIRTVQSGAGKSHGQLWVPRVNEEVYINFINHDPNQPIIMGSVYNDDHLPSHPLPQKEALSGIHSHSLNHSDKKAGHSLIFDDTPDSQCLSLHSQKDFNLDATNNLIHTVNDGEDISVGGDFFAYAKAGKMDIQAKEMHFIVGESSIILNDSGATFKGRQIQLLAKGVGDNRPLARVGDDHQCPKKDDSPHKGGPILKGGDNVLANHLPIARIGDELHCRPCKDTIKKGVDNIAVNGVPLASLNDECDHGGVIVAGSPNVLVGESQDQLILSHLPPPPLKEAHEIVELIYLTGTHTFYALTQQDVDHLEQTAHPLQSAIERLIKANDSDDGSRNKEIQMAKAHLNEVLKLLIIPPPHVKAAGKIKFYEVVRFAGRKWRYVPSQGIKKSWPSYSLHNDMEVRSVFDNNGKLDYHKLKKQIKTQLTAAYKWDKDFFEGSLTEWAEKFDHKRPLEKVLIGDKNNPKLLFSAEAQLLRYTAGASVDANFDLKSHRFSFDADAKASLSLLSAKMKTAAYLPSKNGINMWVDLPDQNGTLRTVSLGAIRVGFEMELSLFSGASILGSVNMECKMVTEQGVTKLKAKGTNQLSSTKSLVRPTQPQAKKEASVSDEKHKAKLETGGTIGVNAFAGIKAGCDFGISVAWLNPEQGHDWSEFASLSAEGDADAGVTFDAEFEIKYNKSKGKFLVHVTAGAACGLGVSGDLIAVVYPINVLSFVQFVYHKIMNANYEFIGFFEADAFKAFINLLTRFVFGLEKDLVTIASVAYQDIEEWWRSFGNNFAIGDSNLQEVETLIDSINSAPDRLKFTPPEVKGRILYLLTDPTLLQRYQTWDRQIQEANFDPLNHWYNQDEINMFSHDAMHKVEDAILKVLSYVQSQADYNNVMQHMSLNPMEKVDIQKSEHRLYTGLGSDGRDQMTRLKKLKEQLDQNKQLVIYQEEPRYNQPVTPNPLIVADT